MLPYLPQPIWRDLSGTIPWSDPIQALSNGSFPENLYWDSTLTYRLEIRQNDGTAPPSQNDALIYLVENYIPGTGAQPTPTTALSITDNQITNPQFANVSFNPEVGLIINTAGTTQIAPGWFVVTSGAGTLTITQDTYEGVSYSSTNASNASTGLSLNNNGFGSVTLTQRFNGNGALWTGEAVCGNVTARASTTCHLTMQVNYSNVTHATILSAQLLTTANTDYRDVVTIPISTNTDDPSVAWTELVLSFTENTTLHVTSVQLIGESSELKIAYLQTTPERQIDQEFNVYKPQLEYKQIPSYLVGWDFPLNPAQFATAADRAVAATAIGANKSKYVWDQTIIFQSANSGVGVTSGAANEMLLTAANTTQMAVIQYLDFTQACELLNSPICVNVSAKSSVNTVATVSLWYTKDVSLPNIATGTYNSIVLTLDANGKPATFNGTWLEVPRSLGDAKFTIETNATTNFNDYPLSGWDMEGDADSNLATFFAIVIGTATVNAAGTIGFNSISLQSGSIPTRPAPQTPDEVLRECEYYFEKSWTPTTLIGTNGAKNAMVFYQGSSEGAASSDMFQEAFAWNYKQTKRSDIPIVLLYSTANSNTSAVVTGVIEGRNTVPASRTGVADIAWASFWTVNGFGSESISYVPIVDNLNTVPTTLTAGTGTFTVTAAYITFHYTIDSRLGII